MEDNNWKVKYLKELYNDAHNAKLQLRSVDASSGDKDLIVIKNQYKVTYNEMNKLTSLIRDSMRKYE
jgi:hypothetical protein